MGVWFFYYHDITEIAAGSYTTCVAGACAPGYIPNVITGYPSTISYSGYADATYRFFKGTRITAGLRYTDETKGLSGQEIPLPGFPDSVATLPPSIVAYPGQPYPGNPTGIPTSLHFDKLTYRLVLAQDFGADIHAYISDNLGFKSGAYNANLFSNPPAKSEVLDAYEAGLKAELIGRRMRVNLSYFYYNYTNVQVRSTAPPAIPGTSILENAAAEHEKGLDLDFTLVPFKGLTIVGGLEALSAKYADFPGTSCSSPGAPVTVSGVLVGRVVTVPCNLAGHDVANAVPFSGSIGLAYNMETFMGLFTLSANEHFEDRHTLVLDGGVIAPAANLVDANLRWTSRDKRYDVEFFARNLGNAYTYVYGVESAGGFAAAPGAPRTYGMTISAHY